MTLPRVWFEREPVAPYRQHVLERVTTLGPAAATPNDPFSALAEAQGIVAGALKYTGEVMARGPEVLVIGRTGIGVDSVDLEAATERGIAVCNAPDAPTISTAEHAVTLILAAAKRLERAQTGLRQGSVDLYDVHHGLELAGKRLALVGYGRIARRVARVAMALDMTVATYDPYVADAPEGVEAADSIDQLVAPADVISVHVPLTAETAGLCGEDFFSRCKRGVVFVNTARGGLVDHDALLGALEAGIVGAAGLDVTDPEPLPKGHPLLHRDDVVVTPHVATATDLGRVKNFEGGYLQVLDVLAGRRPAHLVNPEVWPAVLARLERAG
jgi:phosphoglycerate dehydrogenase-like enzyme